jgi:uncharacterized membrane protein
MREVPDHKHQFHHLGMVQSLPPITLAAAMASAIASNSSATLPSKIDRRAGPGWQSATAGWMGGGAGQQIDAATSGSLSADSSLVDDMDATSRKPRHRLIGLPVFFHRTSFNSKFFPDCLDERKRNSKYCEVGFDLPQSSCR